MNEKWIRVLFIIAGIYDGLLGLVFLFMPEAIFAFYEVIPPNHMAYVEFPAFLLIIFAIMFFRVATDPVRFRELMLFGAGLKFAYCSLVFKYTMTEGVPVMWIPWAWIDLVFLVAFLLAWNSARKLAASGE